MNTKQEELSKILHQIDRTTDWHCHILPGIDDGSPTKEESIEIGRALADLGFKEVYCTPHQIRGGYSPSVEEVYAQIEQLQTELDEAKIDITLMAGMEYYLDEYFFELIDNILPLGNSKRVLVEPPWQSSLEMVTPSLELLTSRGFTPVIAHPERLPVFCGLKSIHPGPWTSFINKFKTPYQIDPLPEQLTSLIDIGCLFQGNIGSFIGCYGKKAQETALYLYRNNIYTLFGTDTHNLAFVENVIKPKLTTSSLTDC